MKNLEYLDPWKNLPDNVHVVIASKGYGKTYHEFRKLIIENKKLKNRINKAIKLIKEHNLCYQSQYQNTSRFDDHLLDILRGKE